MAENREEAEIFRTTLPAVSAVANWADVDDGAFAVADVRRAVVS